MYNAIQIKTNILTWVNEHTGKKIQNLGTDLADGRVFIAIMNQVNSNGPQLEATEARACTKHPELSEHADAHNHMHIHSYPH